MGSKTRVKLELPKAADLLSETLEEEEATDQALTHLAESVINAEAEDDEEQAGAD